ncbi:hypothetical protein QUC31_001355 [Theobroma cacao]|uniref:Uncharacterized protein LOC18592933 n=1 Tax=Theobroma cacao TaxID=3641 RepID=A0AB32WSX3_THECC|nr:PREDICTED: uncharacterized protein LOC18592933 [Theobroma cacao]WRX29939.1 hypothetical protein QQP08_022426 [Theobroma cacao]
MASTEEFSFPTTAALYPCGIDSPPLWRLSPAASPDVFLDRKAKECSTREEEDCFPDRPEKKHQERKSFSYVEKGSKVSSKKVAAEDEEEKMDLLWEDFNEELPTSRSSRSSGDMVELGCAQALKLSKNNAAMFPPRRPGMLVFMRVLRKLFLVHNSQRSVKHRTWQTP